MGARTVERLYCRPHLTVADPVVHHLSQALLPALEHSAHASTLFVDHMALALRAHLVQTYGGIAQMTRRVQPRLAS
ncbi:hypothetical protein [Cupriavidus pauculus]|uniref:Uncharacterized protein n=1 Tax=Cupriavidus pauculus TaxID=82633 RepID=A0A2N5CFI8_9BURK|nr:hypothetical protein [Cupriavidus pauculus]PLQ00942.1 hypothetical protein CYJ10_11060 [Cupriavidus pauculus]